MSTPVLELADVHTYYGKIHALKGVTLTVGKGEIVTLIGSNGAGKSTTLRTISGLLRPRLGDVRLNGQSITATPPHKIVAMGIGHVPEGRGVFPALTVLENLEMGAFLLRNDAEFSHRIELVFQVFPRLLERVEQKARHPLRRRTADARHRPRADEQPDKVLLLDEPSMGLAPVLVEDDLRHPSSSLNEHQGIDHPAGGAERAGSAASRQPRLRARNRAHHHERRPPRRCSSDPKVDRGVSRPVSATRD
jgi:branched-chain amino acid transport system ATP-binding protein